MAPNDASTTAKAREAIIHQAILGLERICIDALLALHKDRDLGHIEAELLDVGAIEDPAFIEGP